MLKKIIVFQPFFSLFHKLSNLVQFSIVLNHKTMGSDYADLTF